MGGNLLSKEEFEKYKMTFNEAMKTIEPCLSKAKQELGRKVQSKVDEYSRKGASPAGKYLSLGCHIDVMNQKFKGQYKEYQLIMFFEKDGNRNTYRRNIQFCHHRHPFSEPLLQFDVTQVVLKKDPRIVRKSSCAQGTFVRVREGYRYYDELKGHDLEVIKDLGDRVHVRGHNGWTYKPLKTEVTSTKKIKK